MPVFIRAYLKHILSYGEKLPFCTPWVKSETSPNLAIQRFSYNPFIFYKEWLVQQYWITVARNKRKNIHISYEQQQVEKFYYGKLTNDLNRIYRNEFFKKENK